MASCRILTNSYQHPKPIKDWKELGALFIKKTLAGITAFSTLLLLHIYFATPVDEAKNTENGSVEVEIRIANSLARFRFDQVSVDIENGILNITQEDTTVCSRTDAVFRISKHINLNDFEPVKLSGRGAVRLNDVREFPLANGNFINIVLVPSLLNRDARQKLEDVVKRKAEIIAAACESLGWGEAAGHQAFDIFTQPTPNLEYLSYEIIEKCSGGRGITLVMDRFSLIIPNEDAENYIVLINDFLENNG